MEIISVQDRPRLTEKAARWFAGRWGVPLDAYLDSMAEAEANPAGIPRWYLAVEGEQILGGCGIIANDFHDRPDLTPNLCALWVDEPWRCRGIAGELLAYAVSEAGRMGYEKLYLITDHTAFYERYGWHFLTMVREEGGCTARLYEIACGG